MSIVLQSRLVAIALESHSAPTGGLWSSPAHFEKYSCIPLVVKLHSIREESQGEELERVVRSKLELAPS
jgi:hypothetical protein